MKISNLKINKRVISLLLALDFSICPFITKAKTDTLIAQNYFLNEENRDDFHFGFSDSGKKLSIINDSDIDKLFSLKKIIPYYDSNNILWYSININRVIYSYQPNSYTLSDGVNSIKCRIYCSDLNNLENIDNTITIIGGSGDRLSGIDLKENRISDNTLIIDVYSGNDSVKMTDIKDMIAISTKFINYLVGDYNKDIHNSIVGISEGAQAAFITAAANNGLYHTLLCSNGAAYWTSNGVNLIEMYVGKKGYKSFRNMKLIFFESMNNNNWDLYVISTLNDLKNNNISMDNISFFTNNVTLYNDAKDILEGEGILYFLSEKEALLYGNWSSHRDGLKMILDSHVLNYLSSENYLNYFSGRKGKVNTSK